MRKRDISISVWLTEDEAERLRAYAELCGFTVSALIRILMRGWLPMPNPPESFWRMLDELYGIHDSSRLITDSSVEISEHACEVQKQIVDFILQVQAAVTLPRKVVLPCGGDEDMGD